MEGHQPSLPSPTQTSTTGLGSSPEGVPHTAERGPTADALRGGGQVYVITYAQNATPVAGAFLDSLLMYCRYRNATLLVLPGRYKNPTSVWADKDRDDEWWAPELAPYLFEGRLAIGDHLTVYGDISIQPTATHPLTGFEVFVGHSSAVFGHPRLQLKTVATAHREYPRLLTTTGAVTLPNYTQSKAGKKGDAHHHLGATVVERAAGGRFHLRQITADADGCFIDLDKVYSGGRVWDAPRALALVCGDIHVAHQSTDVLGATLYADDSIAARLQPERIVYHDVLDFDVRNHHDRGNLQLAYDKATGPMPGNSVHDEVAAAVAFLDTTPYFATPVVVASNHDEAFDRWLKEANPHSDPVNARFYFDSWSKLLYLRETRGNWVGAFEAWYYDLSTRHTAQFLARGEYLKVGDTYVNFHGDKGLNGAKGSAQAYASLGIKTVIGHSHSPCILSGCYQVGVTAALDQGYNYLPSSWLHTHCVIYANGTRSLINVIDGEWRAGSADLAAATGGNNHKRDNHKRTEAVTRAGPAADQADAERADRQWALSEAFAKAQARFKAKVAAKVAAKERSRR